MEVLELKNIIMKMKNSLKGLNSRSELTKETTNLNMGNRDYASEEQRKNEEK